MFQTFIDLTFEKAPMQQKRIQGFLEGCDEVFWSRANDFSERYSAYLESQKLSKDFAVDCFLEMCKDTIVEQIAFQKTGQYSRQQQSTAYEDVYNNTEKMRSYMLALALSQFLWRNHYLLYDYLLETIAKLPPRIGHYLEVGPGHGMFLAAALNHFEADSFTAIDISPSSIAMSQSFLPFLTDNSERAHFIEQDAMTIEREAAYDLVVMGEVIEHLDDPHTLLRKLQTLLTSNGSAFYTTCANCPMIDHIYLFKDANEMRKLFSDCNYQIEHELLLAVEQADEKRIEESAVPTNYGALVSSAR